MPLFNKLQEFERLTRAEQEFVVQCPAVFECDNMSACKLANVHTNCIIFHDLVLKRLNLKFYPQGAKIEEYKALAYPNNKPND